MTLQNHCYRTMEVINLKRFCLFILACFLVICVCVKASKEDLVYLRYPAIGKGGKIGFIAMKGNSASYVFLYDVSNGKLEKLMQKRAVVYSLSFSPDGEKIFYHCQDSKGQATSIWMYDLRSKKQIAVIQNGHINRHPAPSPDGKTLAFSYQVERNAPSDIYLLSLLTNKIENFTRSPSFSEYRPSWSPDGKWIAFTSNMGKNRNYYKIYIKSIDGKFIKRLTDENLVATDPSWAPDGKRLVFSAWKKFAWELYLLHIPEGKLERLTYSKPSQWNREPVFLKDGEHIVFSSQRRLSEGASLYIMDLKTKKIHLLLASSSRKLREMISGKGGKSYEL